MKKILVIIRSCKRDDFIARHCYDSFKKILPDAKYIFFLEEGEYKWLPDEPVIFRRNCDNFGGILNAMPFIEDLRKIDTKEFDFIAVSDADIVMFKNPFEKEFDFAGIQDDNNPRHFSGQLLLYNRRIFNSVVNFSLFKEAVREMEKEKISLADDTVLSYVATMFTTNTQNFQGQGYWIHDKLYELEPK